MHIHKDFRLLHPYFETMCSPHSNFTRVLCSNPCPAHPSLSQEAQLPPAVQAPSSNSPNNKSYPIFPPLERKFQDLRHMQQIHGQLIITGFIRHTPSLTKLLSHSLIGGSAGLTYACKVFKYIHQPNIVIRNTIIRGFVNHDLPSKALSCYVEMLQEPNIFPDRFTFPSLLKGCAQILALDEGKALHGQIVRGDLESDLYIQTTLLNMYAACGDMNSGRILFGKMSHRNQVVWTSMISGYAKNHSPKEALLLFTEMERQGQEPDEVTMASTLSACAQLKNLDYGKKLHLLIKKSGMKICVVLGTALVDMYVKCGELVSARRVFDALPEKNVVAWSAMIYGYAQNNCSKEALELFEKMVTEANLRPNQVTILGVLSACIHFGDLNSGRWIHAYIDKGWVKTSITLQNSLIDMYTKCGRIDAALQIFDAMSEKDVVSWNTMIHGLALHGLGKQALALFSHMQMGGIQPDDITFIGVLSACSHAGLLQEGCYHYQNMYERYGIIPKAEHYGCMVDLLSRAGMLQEAERFIQDMPMEANGAIWGALLSGCRIFNNVELGKKVAERLLDIERENDGVYVLLSNIYAGNKQWAQVRKVRDLMHERGIRRTPGCSSIVVDGVSHEFLVGDQSHPESENIYLMLNHVNQRLKLAGYIAETSPVLLNIDEEDKEDIISRHSEKLAVCYGLMKTRPGDSILILKNLRICGKCHSAVKFISMVFNREITVRDRSRFHHFKDGVCSCGDYW